MERKMKDSGIEWIGQIPEDWELRKIKNLFNIYTSLQVFLKINNVPGLFVVQPQNLSSFSCFLF